MNQAIRIVCAGLLAGAVAYGEVVTWPAAPGTTATNGAFTVKVNGRPVDVVEIPKPTHCLKGDDAHPYYAAFFDADIRGLLPLSRFSCVRLCATP